MRTSLSKLFRFGKCRARSEKSDGRRTRLGVEALEERALMAFGLAGVIGPLTKEIYIPPTPPASFTGFSVIDASRDDSPSTVFTGGALRIDYGLGTMTMALQQQDTGPGGGTPPPPPPPSPLHHVSIEIFQGTTKLVEVGNFTSMNVSSGLVNLAGLSLPAGTLTVKAHAYFNNGSDTVSFARFLTFKTGQFVSGDFTAQSFDISTLTGDGLVVHGRGGSDMLSLNVLASSIASLNGASLSAYTPTAGGQAIYQGLAVDYVRLTNGREIYFTGIERLEILQEPVIFAGFAPGLGDANATFFTKRTVNLMVSPNDPGFANQWNLHVTDVPDAWRFTRGSSNILLVSLDTGVLTTATGGGAITGINANRLITDSSDNDNTSSYGHGHQAISVMAATANDSAFQAGINWVSNVFVTDVYNGVNLRNAIQSAFDFADARGLKIVFQGGIQGESWLTSGGTQAALEDLINTHTNRALFAIAAGNGGPGGNLTDPNFMTSVSGVAKLESNHSNVMSVGALQRTATTSGGFANASAVNLASYSNRGSNLTMVAPTDSPATNFFGSSTFTGTSCANPNMAAMASLVWSANSNLTAVQVRSILQSTAMDLGSAGEDNTFGSGLVDTGRAVRRAVALARDAALANLGINFFFNVSTLGISQLVSGPALKLAPALSSRVAPPDLQPDADARGVDFIPPALANEVQGAAPTSVVLSSARVVAEDIVFAGIVDDDDLAQPLSSINEVDTQGEMDEALCEVFASFE